MRTTIIALLCGLGFALADPPLKECGDINYAGCGQGAAVACPNTLKPPTNRNPCQLQLHFSQTEDIYCCAN
ncbi:hypothetical protein EJ03DRAFT_349813 [Teratosphaeria nubilosa]|uniref:Uncharacterized protein n=1 Tax=Teratosphaeria nubilosa TaxID=161662 RepID=A0A6G1LFV7_9PEZI|nr:hypothetical protein EJ03DRAFT_349813 [Teratosphaeria nubilosa]